VSRLPCHDRKRLYIRISGLTLQPVSIVTTKSLWLNSGLGLGGRQALIRYLDLRNRAKGRKRVCWSCDGRKGVQPSRKVRIDVAGLGDAELRVAISRLTASWSETEITSDITALLETLLLPRVSTNVRAVRWPTPGTFTKACVSEYFA
jgi:hypothetical protein